MSSPHTQFSFGFQRERMTWGVQTLILINVAVFALQLLLFIPLGASLREVPGGLVAQILSFVPGLVVSGWLWQAFTYHFLHANLQHLFFNMLWLFVFGRQVERTLGTRQFIRFYLICGTLGVLPTLLSLLQNERAYTVVGASGAVMGVLVAFVVIEPKRELFLFPLPFPIYAWVLLLIVLVMNIMTALPANTGGTSVATHLGGMAVGYGYMKLVPKMRQRRIRRKRNEIHKTVGDAVDNIFDFRDPGKKK